MSVHKRCSDSALCNNSNLTIENGEIIDREGNPTELALLEMAVTMNPDVYKMLSDRNTVAEIPFSSDRKYMASVVPVNGNSSSGLELLVKGSPEVVVSKCDRQITASGLEQIDRNEWLQTAQELAGQGQRVLALAAKDCTTSPDQFGADAVSGLVLVGLVGLIDAPRVDAAEAVRNSQNSGIQVVMVTGDHAATARTIAIELGILWDQEPLPLLDEDHRVITGRQLQDMSDEEHDDNGDVPDVARLQLPESGTINCQSAAYGKQVPNVLSYCSNGCAACGALLGASAVGLQHHGTKSRSVGNNNGRHRQRDSAHGSLKVDRSPLYD